MQNYCYTIAIRQLRCENSIPRRVDNVYTNTSIGTTFPLSFGYTLTLLAASENFITIRISNNNFIPDITFNIPRDNYKIFNLPKENGNITIYVGAIFSECNNTIPCCRNIN